MYISNISKYSAENKGRSLKEVKMQSEEEEDAATDVKIVPVFLMTSMQLWGAAAYLNVKLTQI